MKDISANDLQNNIPLVAKRHDGDKVTVKVGKAEIGGDKVVVIAGPCTVEALDQVLDIAKQVKDQGVVLLRGGAYKPLTFPYRSAKTFELREKGLEILAEARKVHNIGVVTEVVDVRLVGQVAEVADMLQIGARNMSNFPLLEEAAKTRKPILLKRHPGMGLRDWLGAAEYLYFNGNTNVVLCERGVVAPHTHEPTSRFIVDLQVVPAVREYSRLPVIVDPSHATFKRKYVAPVARAAVAVGADGLLLDVHPTPEEAAVDPLQGLDYAAFAGLMKEIRAVAAAVGRSC